MIGLVLAGQVVVPLAMLLWLAVLPSGLAEWAGLAIAAVLMYRRC